MPFLPKRSYEQAAKVVRSGSAIQELLKATAWTGGWGKAEDDLQRKRMKALKRRWARREQDSQRKTLTGHLGRAEDNWQPQTLQGRWEVDSHLQTMRVLTRHLAKKRRGGVQ